MNSILESVAVVGLGRLGAPVGAFLASKGLRVLGVDTEGARAAAFRSGKVPDEEPGVNERLLTHGDRITLGSLREAVASCEVVVFVLPTESTMDGKYSCSVLESVLVSCAQELSALEGRRLFVVMSTVFPGTMKQLSERMAEIIPADRFGLCYSPLFAARGEVIDNLEYAPLIILGVDDDATTAEALALYRRLGHSPERVRCMTYESAEVAKLMLNSFVTMKISFANFVSAVCAQTPGASAHSVLSAMAIDPRIGGGAFSGGPPYGGPCFPRDNRAVVRYAQSCGVPAALPEAIDRFNEYWALTILDTVRKLSNGRGRVAVVGLAYKERTADTSASHGVWLLRALTECGSEAIGFDANACLGDELSARGLAIAPSLPAALEGAHVIVLAVKGYEDEVAVAAPGDATVLNLWKQDWSGLRNP